MAAAWRGAIELAGFTANVALHSRVKSKSSESFKTLGSNDKPIRQVLVESTEFEKLEKDPQAAVRTIGRNDTRKGVAVGKDEWKALSPEAIEQIQSAERSEVVAPHSFVPADELPLALADKAFVVVPDDKVAGSEQGVMILWNGLRESGLAYTTQIVTRAGSPDAILAIYAQDDGLYGVALPFVDQLAPTPTWEPVENGKAADLFGQLIEASCEVAEGFEHTAYVSEYRTRRTKAIEAVLAGKKVEAPKAKPKASSPDLMAALEAAVQAADKAPRKNGSKAKSKAKPKAKARKKVAA